MIFSKLDIFQMSRNSGHRKSTQPFLTLNFCIYTKIVLHDFSCTRNASAILNFHIHQIYNIVSEIFNEEEVSRDVLI